MASALRLLLILILVLATSACGVRLAYYHLDWLAMRWVNKQVTLNPVQEMTFRDALEDKLDWHCRSELPRYVPFLESMADMLQAERVTVGEIEALGERAADFGQRLVDRAMPSVVELFASLDDAQVEELLASIDERNREFREERIDADAAQRRADRIESMQRSLKRFIGSTSDAQNDRLVDWADSLLYVAPRMHSHQQQWRDKLAALLASRNDVETFGPALAALFQPAGDWPNDFRAVMAVNRQRTLAMLVDIHASLSPRQKRRLLSRLNSLSRDFERLSCEQDGA
jgi:hypothetical protein